MWATECDYRFFLTVSHFRYHSSVIFKVRKISCGDICPRVSTMLWLFIRVLSSRGWICIYIASEWACKCCFYSCWTFQIKLICNATCRAGSLGWGVSDVNPSVRFSLDWCFCCLCSHQHLLPNNRIMGSLRFCRKYNNY